MRILIFLSFCATIAVAFGRTPAERQITAAQEAIAKNPNHAEYHSNLALALARRARETADSSYYDKAEAAVSAALVIEPESFSALKTRADSSGQARICKGARTGDRVEQANARRRDGVRIPYGANIELGRYAEAEKSAQWMLNLRPGNIPALTRAAYLREMFGDIDGSIELMQMAYQQLPMAETEDRAWTLTQLGHLASGCRQDRTGGPSACRGAECFSRLPLRAWKPCQGSASPEAIRGRSCPGKEKVRFSATPGKPILPC